MLVFGEVINEERYKPLINNMTQTILIVDDDENQRRIAQHIIGEKLGYNTLLAEGGQEALDIITGSNSPTLDLVLLDLAMPIVSGMDVLQKLKPLKNIPPIIVRTAHDDVDIAVNAMKAGAIDFAKKQDGIDRLQNCIQNALHFNELNDELLRLKRRISEHTTFSDIIGSSSNILQTITLGKKAADSTIPVILEGESGVGKELLARSIHNRSERRTNHSWL